MEISEKAPAKINLGLDVLRKRDDGYHDLEMVMASVDLADRLTFHPNIKDNKIEIITETSFLPTDKRNHIYQACALVKKRYAITDGIKIVLDKHIPVSAGLAGGSSDAAACLRGLNQVWSLNLSLEELAELGSEIGSDVPYCIYSKTAFASGRGEQIELLPSVPQCWVVLVKPKISVSTQSVFSRYNLKKGERPDIQKLKAAIIEQSYEKMIAQLGNALESVTIYEHPIVAQIKSKMLHFGADAALMSGSGPTVFALCQKHSRAQRVYNGLKGFCQEVYLVRTLP